jgi:hypothetical protein
MHYLTNGILQARNQGVQKHIFFFKYSGKMPNEQLRQKLHVKTFECFVDPSDMYTNAVLVTNMQTRATTIQNTIESYNRQMLADSAKIILRRQSEADELIMTMSREDGEHIGNYGFYKRITAARDRNDPSYYIWNEAIQRQIIADAEAADVKAAHGKGISSEKSARVRSNCSAAGACKHSAAPTLEEAGAAAVHEVRLAEEPSEEDDPREEAAEDEAVVERPQMHDGAAATSVGADAWHELLMVYDDAAATPSPPGSRARPPDDAGVAVVERPQTLEDLTDEEEELPTTTAEARAVEAETRRAQAEAAVQRLKEAHANGLPGMVEELGCVAAELTRGVLALEEQLTHERAALVAERTAGATALRALEERQQGELRKAEEAVRRQGEKLRTALRKAEEETADERRRRAQAEAAHAATNTIYARMVQLLLEADNRDTATRLAANGAAADVQRLVEELGATTTELDAAVAQLAQAAEAADKRAAEQLAKEKGRVSAALRRIEEERRLKGVVEASRAEATGRVQTLERELDDAKAQLAQAAEAQQQHAAALRELEKKLRGEARMDLKTVQQQQAALQRQQQQADERETQQQHAAALDEAKAAQLAEAQRQKAAVHTAHALDEAKAAELAEAQRQQAAVHTAHAAVVRKLKERLGKRKERLCKLKERLKAQLAEATGRVQTLERELGETKAQLAQAAEAQQQQVTKAQRQQTAAHAAHAAAACKSKERVRKLKERLQGQTAALDEAKAQLAEAQRQQAAAHTAHAAAVCKFKERLRKLKERLRGQKAAAAERQRRVEALMGGAEAMADQHEALCLRLRNAEAALAEARAVPPLVVEARMRAAVMDEMRPRFEAWAGMLSRAADGELAREPEMVVWLDAFKNFTYGCIELGAPWRRTITTEALNLGYSKLTLEEFQTIGKVLLRLYKAAHGNRGPTKHLQFLRGAVRLVNSYYRADTPLMRQAIDEVLSVPEWRRI